MKEIIITIISAVILCNSLWAQQLRIVSSGKIEYEKTINMNALLKKIYGDDPQSSMLQSIIQIQKTKPQFKVLKSSLAFNNNKTLFAPIAPEIESSDAFKTSMADQLNTVFSDYNINSCIIQKNISDTYVLIIDSLRKIKWKITNEKRMIAGYSCRRANGLMLDSIYVVAFYTDKISVPGGPESFGGLPGMILEVAVPHENVIWKASKISEEIIPAIKLLPPKKGKLFNNKQFYDYIKNLIPNRSLSGQVSLAIKGYLL